LDVIELEPTDDCEDPDFLLIQSIRNYFDYNIGVVFCGIRFRYSKHFLVGSSLSNEVTLLAHVAVTACTDPIKDAEDKVSPNDVVRKRELEFGQCTASIRNPAESQPSDKPKPSTTSNKSEAAPDLVCKTMFICYYHQKPTTKSDQPFEWELRHLKSSQRDRFGNRPKESTSINTKFTYVSGFSGGGGEVTGAIQAGAQVLLAFDHNKSACQTLRYNQPSLNVYCGDQWNVTQLPELIPNLPDFTEAGVDMLHLSTPCQKFSSMHVVPGVNDEVNSAVLFCTEAMLARFNPIIHTQEQAAGLFSRHPQYFLRLISDIFESEYNIRWRLCRFRDWGMAARRRRLIIIAARLVGRKRNVEQ
jgi:hypothetical protein